MSLITDVEEKIKTVDEVTEAIYLKLEDKLMQEELENNGKYVLSVRTQICMYMDSFPNKVCSQNNSVNIENSKTVITLESFENNSSYPFPYFTFKKT